jgi:hypothetical protein
MLIAIVSTLRDQPIWYQTLIEVLVFVTIAIVVCLFAVIKGAIRAGLERERKAELEEKGINPDLTEKAEDNAKEKTKHIPFIIHVAALIALFAVLWLFGML